ncbi:class I SAM-dependent methyltransferase [Amycolatopsis umgeniensis]|uniref:class I SAM-dependent methyltransferase n=1 Tax=Amycolatopsis umgeniensis TaxID=336628 RepID=UPI003636DA72
MHGGQPWEDRAHSWIDWVRAERRSGFTSQTWPALEAILPSHVAGRVLDLGCGEGRSARELTWSSYDVVGVESSSTLATAARFHEVPTRVLLGDATSLPFADSCFSLVVACMSLQDIVDLPTALSEVGRVLEAGGSLCLSIRHPSFTAIGGSWERERPRRQVQEYLKERTYEEHMSNGPQEMRFESFHRPLAAYVGAITAAGLAVTCLNEIGDGVLPQLLVARAIKL